MLAILQEFGPDQRGSTSIEYSLIAIVVSLAIITTAQALGVTLGDVFTKVGNGFPP